MERPIVKIEYFQHPPDCENCEDMPEWYCSIPSIKGIGESGMTKEEAFNQCMKSLIVLIMYESGITAEEALTWKFPDIIQ